MASVPVTIIGTMTYTDVGVGGGPMPGGPVPSHPIAPGGAPPGIWGGAPLPWPTPPIYYPPVSPPGIWGGAPLPVPTPPIYYPPSGLPSHPIYWPPAPTHPIAPGGSGPGGEAPDSPGSGNGGSRWAWSPVYGWVWLPSGSGDKPHPPQQPPETGSESPHVEHHSDTL